MKSWVMAFCCWFAVGRAGAQPGAGVVSASSASGQFQAFAPPRPGLPVAIGQQSRVPGVFILNPTPAANPGSKLSLDPSLLVTSSERIKQALLLTLGQKDEWRGRITFFINPSLRGDQIPLPERVYAQQVWSYQLTLPSPIEPQVLFRAVVGVLLMETANRKAGAQSAEVPLWLVAGLTAHLQKDNLPTLLLLPQSRIISDHIRDPRVDPLRDQLRQQPPLTFQELCWPEPERLAGQNYDFYSASAQLFVEQLLRFPDGPRCLRAMLGELPEHLNWQTSFLKAFSPHFTRLLDVEKWWALTCLNFTGVDFASRFDPPDSWRKLQQALDVPVEVHLSPDRLPAPAEINLQEIISTWDAAQAADALRHVVESLELLRLRLAPDLRPLLDRYLAIVQTFQNDTRHDNLVWLAKYRPSELIAVRRNACKQLDALDAQREAMRSQYLSLPAQAQFSARPSLPTPAKLAVPAGK